MQARVVVNRAGSGAANNLIRSLRAAPRPVYVIGCHYDPFILRKSAADTNRLLPRVGHEYFTEALCQVMRTERADLFLPHTDLDQFPTVARLADVGEDALAASAGGGKP